MDADDLRARILATAPVKSVEAELLDDLRELPEVHTARAAWFHGWVEITVVLSEWTWEAMQRPDDLIDTFARKYVREFGVTHTFAPMELQP